MLDSVSILILLEIALEGYILVRLIHANIGFNPYSAGNCSGRLFLAIASFLLRVVSILILLEIALEVLRHRSTSLAKSLRFNPYSAGNCSGRLRCHREHRGLASFNPYSAGNCSGSATRTNF